MKPELIDTNSPVGQRLNALFALAKEIRGTLIDQAIWMDALVTESLAFHFCADPERRLLLRSDVLTGRDSTFSGRIDVFEKVLKRSYPDALKRNPQLINNLNSIRRLRNRLAHSHLDTSDKFMSAGHTDRIGLVFFEDGTEKHQVITVQEYRERLKECSRVILALTEVQEAARGTAQ